MTQETRARLSQLHQEATPIDHAVLIRYEHGGGRYYSAEKRSVDEALYHGEEHRTLIADFYHEADRELFVLLRESLTDLLDAARRLEHYQKIIDSIRATVESDKAAMTDYRMFPGLGVYRHVLALFDSYPPLDAPASPGRERGGTTHG